MISVTPQWRINKRVNIYAIVQKEIGVRDLLKFSLRTRRKVIWHYRDGKQEKYVRIVSIH
ncbi:hypothetical protein EXU57_09985 [Segetibacter sp. 3557_3]|uniref:hypothetical protein n=1 Tax=Segetibacter sp. 3557_3 TaxID=2547429 RepID=UPI001058B352|nr:hypothetical protein [Segetibacter sp. 3557_3]TDH26418.1 hypothetical protein EXU57_09985 [Segetibacter sp. 3557_3]